MTLNDLMGNKSRALVLGTALTAGGFNACGGDQISNYYMTGSGPNGAYTCNDIYQRYVVECHANGNDEWKGTKECESMDIPNTYPEWTQCIFSVSCEEINEVCDPLVKD